MTLDIINEIRDNMKDEDNWDNVCQGFSDAADGEPLFPDAARSYAIGWSYFHGCGNPSSAGSVCERPDE